MIMQQNKMVSAVGIVIFTVTVGILAFGLSAQIVPTVDTSENFLQSVPLDTQFGNAEMQVFEASLPTRLGQELETFLPPLPTGDHTIDLQSLNVTTQTEMTSQAFARGLHGNCGGY
jgi:hypothetical protein